ncbi:MAG: DNA repair protein RecO [Planctomycetota bacterium]|jgi:DNA repair protein RecO (recombination protein O)
MLSKDEAICIRALDYSETSQIVTFLTRQSGKVGAIAKGSKRLKSAFDGPIEVFAHGKIVFSDSNKDKLATLTEFEQQPAFTNFSTNLFAFNCCLFAAELTDKMTEDYDPHPQLFDSLLRLLQTVNEKGHALAPLILFQLSLLREVGLHPIVNACANCKTRCDIRAASDEVYFSSFANGLICRDCEGSFQDKIKISPESAGCLGNVNMIQNADEKALREIEKVLAYHFTELLGHRPKMAKYVMKS